MSLLLATVSPTGNTVTGAATADDCISVGLVAPDAGAPVSVSGEVFTDSPLSSGSATTATTALSASVADDGLSSGSVTLSTSAVGASNTGESFPSGSVIVSTVITGASRTDDNIPGGSLSLSASIAVAATTDETIASAIAAIATSVSGNGYTDDSLSVGVVGTPAASLIGQSYLDDSLSSGNATVLSGISVLAFTDDNYSEAVASPVISVSGVSGTDDTVGQGSIFLAVGDVELSGSSHTGDCISSAIVGDQESIVSPATGYAYRPRHVKARPSKRSSGSVQSYVEEFPDVTTETPRFTDKKGGQDGILSAEFPLGKAADLAQILSQLEPPLTGIPTAVFEPISITLSVEGQAPLFDAVEAESLEEQIRLAMEEEIAVMMLLA